MKDIDYNKNYNITNYGDIINIKTGKKLRPDIADGYQRVTLSFNGQKKRFSVHRLVATKYIPNSESKPCVNHKNGVKTDNRVENLEWCTFQENEKHSFDILGKKVVHSQETRNKMREKAIGRDMTKAIQASIKKSKGNPAHNRIKVTLSDGRKFSSLTEASKATGITASAISQNLSNKSRKTKVGKWSYDL